MCVIRSEALWHVVSWQAGAVWCIGVVMFSGVIAGVVVLVGGWSVARGVVVS